jgi:hypothetical protein
MPQTVITHGEPDITFLRAYKVHKDQARRIVVNMDGSGSTVDKVVKQIPQIPVEGLKQLIFVKNGEIVLTVP